MDAVIVDAVKFLLTRTKDRATSTGDHARAADLLHRIERETESPVRHSGVPDPDKKPGK